MTCTHTSTSLKCLGIAIAKVKDLQCMYIKCLEIQAWIQPSIHLTQITLSKWPQSDFAFSDFGWSIRMIYSGHKSRGSFYRYEFPRQNMNTNMILFKHCGSTVAQWYGLLTQDRQVCGSRPLAGALAPRQGVLLTIISLIPGVVNGYREQYIRCLPCAPLGGQA